MEIPPKVSISTLRAKRATFKVLCFFQPFMPFEKLFTPSKLCLIKNHSQKGLQIFKKGKTGFAKHKKIIRKFK